MDSIKVSRITVLESTLSKDAAGEASLMISPAMNRVESGAITTVHHRTAALEQGTTDDGVTVDTCDFVDPGDPGDNPGSDPGGVGGGGDPGTDPADDGSGDVLLAS